ncbi:hypothetical protein QR680_017359 [Steinernema hermaphroditum]|uniref:DUF4461 domain-containing protein n=1 Tax=Steinernema hermaphroditum TaxID=289476 RepID=A0AA39LP51_9BILA|nr:hypothetical protein QR680_017359 [Steinernema hermaphroditum]
MFSNSPRRVLWKTPSCAFSRRFLSAQQAAVALRPFLFEIHPDRARDSSTREQNEKSLQIFNGYLSELFSNRFGDRPPVEVNFSIVSGGSKRNVSMLLSGSDPNQIVRMALEKCGLSTEHLPRTKLSHSAPPSFSGAPDVSEMFRKMYSEEAPRVYRRRHAPRSRDLFSGVVRIREEALKNMKSWEQAKESLAMEIDYLKHRTGLKDILWSINWHQTHMRRCLAALNRLLDQSTPEVRDTMVHALDKRVLRFGRGSYVCCDGGLQFAADDVPENWQQLCIESHVRRLQLRTLGELRKHLSELFGARIVIADEGNLLRTVNQFRSVIVRVTSKADPQKLRALSSNTVIEVVTAYDELALAKDGCLKIPCNVDVAVLLEFLKENAQKALEVSCKERREQVHNIEVESLKDECCRQLKLKDVSWETGLAKDALVKCLQRLQNAKEEVRLNLAGLRIRIATNPNVYATQEGQFPLERALELMGYPSLDSGISNILRCRMALAPRMNRFRPPMDFPRCLVLERLAVVHTGFCCRWNGTPNGSSSTGSGSGSSRVTASGMRLRPRPLLKPPENLSSVSSPVIRKRQHLLGSLKMRLLQKLDRPPGLQEIETIPAPVHRLLL